MSGIAPQCERIALLASAVRRSPLPPSRELQHQSSLSLSQSTCYLNVHEKLELKAQMWESPHKKQRQKMRIGFLT